VTGSTIPASPPANKQNGHYSTVMRCRVLLFVLSGILVISSCGSERTSSSRQVQQALQTLSQGFDQRVDVTIWYTDPAVHVKGACAYASTNPDLEEAALTSCRSTVRNGVVTADAFVNGDTMYLRGSVVGSLEPWLVFDRLTDDDALRGFARSHPRDLGWLASGITVQNPGARKAVQQTDECRQPEPRLIGWETIAGIRAEHLRTRVKVCVTDELRRRGMTERDLPATDIDLWMIRDPAELVQGRIKIGTSELTIRLRPAGPHVAGTIPNVRAGRS
jgi:hypothetical protein